MNKIYVYIFGFLCWVQATVCYATEKFEILPDLPEPLAYAVQPAAASTISGTTNTAMLAEHSVGHEPNVISVVLSLLFVVLLIYLTGILYAKLNKMNFKTMRKQQGELSKSQVAVISTTQLGGNKTLHVVELDGKRMLIGASSSAIQLIKDLGSIQTGDLDDEFSHIEIPNIKIPKIEIPKIEIPSINFSKLVTKAHKGLADIENVVTEEKQSTVDNQDVDVQETSIIDENQEGIIDSLFSQQQEDIPEVVEENPATEHIVDPDDFALYKKYLS